VKVARLTLVEKGRAPSIGKYPLVLPAAATDDEEHEHGREQDGE